MPSVLISCIPKLNDAQQKGMLNLFKDMEAQGYTVYFWADDEYDVFANYVVQKLSPANKIITYWNYRRAKRKVDKDKWLPRLKRWTGAKNEESASYQFKNYLRECSRIFARTRPNAFFCWNPFCCRFGIAFDTAKILGYTTRGIEWGYLPATFILDREGTQALSAAFNKNPLTDFGNEQLGRFTKKGETIFQTLKTASQSLYQQAKADIPADLLTADKPLVRILVLGIDEVDAGAVPADHPDRGGLLPFHESSYQQAIAIAAADENYRVIFKPHPSHNQYGINTRVSNRLAIVNGNPDELIDWADVIFCTGSKMEFSVILKDKALINWGAGLLYGKNCSYEINNTDSMREVIKLALSNVNADIYLANFYTFLGYLDEEYLYNYTGSQNNAVANVLNTNN